MVKNPVPAAIFDTSVRWLEVARLGRPHGVKGEVRVQLYHPDSPLWDVDDLQLRAHVAGRPDRLVTMIDLRPGTGCMIIEFAEVQSRDAAAALTNATLLVSEAQLPPADDDEIYVHELLGADVMEAETGEVVGRVLRLVETHVDLLQIELLAGGEALIPLDAEAIESLGREKGKVVIRHVLDWKS